MLYLMKNILAFYDFPIYFYDLGKMYEIHT
jgi:hypothetical protein